MGFYWKTLVCLIPSLGGWDVEGMSLFARRGHSTHGHKVSVYSRK